MALKLGGISNKRLGWGFHIHIEVRLDDSLSRLEIIYDSSY